MPPNNLMAIIGIIGAVLSSTGGLGYAVVQWWLKRNDPEARANAARVLTDAAAGIIAELQEERDRKTEEILLMSREISSFKKSVRKLVIAVEDIVPMLSAPQITAIREAVETLRERM